MKFYLAPMEGLTGYVFRNAYQTYFHDIDRYFTPFIVNKKMSHRELSDILPEHNQGMDVIPQVLTNQAEDVLSLAEELQTYGYQEINLNLGCPSGTVAAKNRGAGFLALTDDLNTFLDTIFSRCCCKVSIKTRIGKLDPAEWETILSIYEKYPVGELIIHPRIQQDFYKHPVRMEAYRYACEHSRHSLCYNGDLFCLADYQAFCQTFPQTEKIMLGRGILMNPGLTASLRDPGQAPILTRELLRHFHDDILLGYEEIMSGDRNVLFKMKELWFYLGHSFASPEKYLKKIRKAQRLSDYQDAVNALFASQELVVPTSL